MKQQNLHYVTWLIVLVSVLYAGWANVSATYFETDPGAEYTCTPIESGFDCTENAKEVDLPTPTTNETGSTAGETEEVSVEATPTMAEETADDSDDSDDSEETADQTMPTNSMYEGDEEIIGAYDFGFENGLTTLPLEESRLYDGLTRNELAKMISAFIKNVEWKDAVDNSVCDITTFTDYATFDDEMKIYIKMACDYGIMGWKNDKSWLIEAFRPFDTVTREEFGAVLSRHLFGSAHDGDSMLAHLEALRDSGIMNQIDNPFTVEVRGYVLLMLQRTATIEDEAMEEEAMTGTGAVAEDEAMEEEAMTNTGAVAEDEAMEEEAMTNTGAVAEDEVSTGTQA